MNNNRKMLKSLPWREYYKSWAYIFHARVFICVCLYVHCVCVCVCVMYVYLCMFVCMSICMTGSVSVSGCT